jgi:hypothetical protein
MWECIKCRCKAIAADLGFCPQCFKPKEDDVPKATTGGASNANAEPGEPGYIEPEKVHEAWTAPAEELDPGEPEKPAVPAAPAKPSAPAAAAKAAEPPPAPAAKPAEVPAKPMAAIPVAVPVKPVTDTPKTAA